MGRRYKRGSEGFTLVEVLVVVAILAILAAIITPTFIGYIDKAKEEVCISEARVVSVGVQTYIVEQYAEGTLSRNNIKKDILLHEMGHPNHALTETLRGSYTEGARITSITFGLDGTYGGIEYEVNEYKVIIIPKTGVTVEKRYRV